jgi:8-oxo-dGTP pyrophosphatase MutT (NUDIX family)
VTQIREAATVMVVRDAPDLHVFMLRRNLNSDFVGGAYVFPGGAVDDEDRDPALVARCVGLDDTHASALVGARSGGIGFWVAAIRETFEEAGVLFARERASGHPVIGGSDEYDAARRAIGRHERGFREFVESEDLLLDVGALHVFAHWITPTGMPRRYDTWFFVAEAPDGHGYRHDDTETVESTWIRPADALAAAHRQELSIIFPTQRNLEAIGRFPVASELLEIASSASSIEAVQPRIVDDGNGVRLLLPGDPGYDDVPELPDGALGPTRADSSPREESA